MSSSLDEMVNHKSALATNKTRRFTNPRTTGSRSTSSSDHDRTIRFMNRGPTELDIPSEMARMVVDNGGDEEEGYNGNSEAKIYISNLDYGVSNLDIKLLFSDVGELRSQAVHYDESGRSKGTAEVVFARQVDALAAIRKYNNLPLDGKRMVLELVGADSLFHPMDTSNIRKPSDVFSRLSYDVGEENIGPRRRSHGGFRGQETRKTREQVKRRKPTSEELDADMERYRLKAINTERRHG